MRWTSGSLQASSQPSGADAQHGERIAWRSRSHRGPGGALGHLGLDLLEDRGEQLALVGELVVERAARDAGRAHDLLGADARVTRARRKSDGRRPERRAGGLGRALRAWCRLTFILSVLYYAYSLYAT